jgi:hypothetical protein
MNHLIKMAASPSYDLFVNSRDRQYGSASDFTIPPIGSFSTAESFRIVLKQAIIPNCVPTFRSDINTNPLFVKDNNAAISTVAMVEGYYNGSTIAAAFQAWLVAAGFTNATVTYSTTTNHIGFQIGSVGTSLTFKDTLAASTLNRKLSQTERFLEVLGLGKIRDTSDLTSIQSSVTLNKTLTNIQYYGANCVKLTGTDFVDISTDAPLRTYHSTLGNNNVFARIPLTAAQGGAATVNAWESTTDEVGHPIQGSHFNMRIYLVDEWGDLFPVPSNFNVSLRFRLTPLNSY